MATALDSASPVPSEADEETLIDNIINVATTSTPATTTTTTTTTHSLSNQTKMGAVYKPLNPLHSNPFASLPSRTNPPPLHANNDMFTTYRERERRDSLSSLENMHKKDTRSRSFDAPFTRTQSHKLYTPQGHSDNFSDISSNDAIQRMSREIESLRHSLNEVLTLRTVIDSTDHRNKTLLEESIAMKLSDIERIKTELEKMKTLRTTHNTRFPLPPDNLSRSKNTLKSLLEMIPRHSPDLFTLLTRVSETAVNQGLSHSDVKTVLVNTLTGDALHLYRSMSSHPLPDIISALERRFLAPHSISYYTSQLSSFKREKNERLEQTLERARFLIRESSKGYAPEDQIGRERSLCHSILMQSVSPHVANWLSLQEEKHLRKGQILSIQELIGLAEDAEALSDSKHSHTGVENVEATVNETTGILRPARLRLPRSPTPRRDGRDPSRSRARSVESSRDERRYSQNSRSRERRDEVTSRNRALSADRERSVARPTSRPETRTDRTPLRDLSNPRQEERRPSRTPSFSPRQSNFNQQTIGHENYPPRTPEPARPPPSAFDPLYRYPYQRDRQYSNPPGYNPPHFPQPSPRRFQFPRQNWDFPNIRQRGPPPLPFEEPYGYHRQHNRRRPMGSITTHGPLMQRLYFQEMPLVYQSFDPEYNSGSRPRSFQSNSSRGNYTTSSSRGRNQQQYRTSGGYMNRPPQNRFNSQQRYNNPRPHQDLHSGAPNYGVQERRRY